MNATPALTLPAPAKLNIFLHVTGRRPDGYHTLESLFVLIAHGDSISLSMRDDGAVVRTRGPAAIAADDDLAVRAARLLQRHCHIAQGVSIGIALPRTTFEQATVGKASRWTCWTTYSFARITNTAIA